ncbi:MAG: TraB/GumN family protein [Paludibacter sp.]|nr:TraB/GumN family protein [Paludibacter sp.]
MKKIFLNFCLTIICISSTNAQLLWKITGNGLKHPSYLFGTHHLIPLQFLDSVPGLYKAFNECEIVVGEMVMSNIDATAKIQQAAIMPDHIKMSDLLSDEEYKKIDTELKSVLKMGLKELSIMNPSLILTLYKMEYYKKLTGYSDETQSDSYFQLVATEKEKKVVGLETIDQQIKILFGNGNLERQADILVETIQKKDSFLNEIDTLNSLYKSGKIEELIKISKQKGNLADFTQEEYSVLVDNRNKDWVTKLPRLFDENSCFVAVGALHLGGENGLIKLLGKAGYKVKAVTISNP